MHDVACEFARAVVHSKDTQKQLAQTFLKQLERRTIKVFGFHHPLKPCKALLWTTVAQPA